MWEDTHCRLVTDNIPMEQKKTHGGPRPGSGRKPIGPTPLDVKFLVPMAAAMREKVKALGGAAWVRNKIDKAKVPALRYKNLRVNGAKVPRLPFAHRKEQHYE
jgi:hypothetical protein